MATVPDSTSSGAASGAQARLVPLSGRNPTVDAAAGRIVVLPQDGPPREFAQGDGRDKVALVTEYRTHVTLPGGTDKEYRGVMLRCLDGQALVWLTNSPLEEIVYRPGDVQFFCEQAGLRYDEMTLDYATLLRITGDAQRAGEGTGEVKRSADTVGRAASAGIVLGALACFAALAMFITNVTVDAARIITVLACFVIVVFGFSWLGHRLAARTPPQDPGRRKWFVLAGLGLIATVVCAVADVRVGGAPVAATCLVPLGFCLWCLGIPGLPWSQAALLPRQPAVTPGSNIS